MLKKAIILILSIFCHFQSFAQNSQVSIRMINAEENEALLSIYRNACSGIYTRLMDGKMKAWRDRELTSPLNLTELKAKFTLEIPSIVMDNEFYPKDTLLLIEGGPGDIVQFDLVNEVSEIRIDQYSKIYVQQKELRKAMGKTNLDFFLYWMNLSGQTEITYENFKSETASVLKKIEKKLYDAAIAKSIKVYSPYGLVNISDSLDQILRYEEMVSVLDSTDQISTMPVEFSYTSDDITGLSFLGELKSSLKGIEVEYTYIGLLYQPEPDRSYNESSIHIPLFWSTQKSGLKLLSKEELYLLELCSHLHNTNQLNLPLIK